LNTRKQAVKGVIWSAAGNWGHRLIGLGVFIILARMLNKEDFGLVAFASVVTALANIFREQGIGQALVQRSNLEPGHVAAALWLSLVSGAVCTTLLLISSGVIADYWIRHPAAESVLRGMSVAFFIRSVASVPTAVLNRNMAFDKLSARKLISELVGGGVAIALAVCGFGVWSLVGQAITSALIGSIILWVAAAPLPLRGAKRRHLADLFGFGASVLGTQLLQLLNRRLPQLLIPSYLGTVALGTFQIAARLHHSLASLMTRSIGSVALPTLSRLQKDPEQVRNAFSTATAICTTLSLPTFMAMSLLAEPLVLTLLGDKWLSSAKLFQILAFQGMLGGALFVTAPAMKAAGKPSWVLKISAISALANVIMLPIGLRWGLVGIAAASVIRYYVLAPLSILGATRAIGMPFNKFCRLLIAPFISALPTAAVVYAVSEWSGDRFGPLGVLLISLTAGISVHAASVRVFAPAVFDKIRELIGVAISR
jgi:polysaccharide transporter, PST family